MEVGFSVRLQEITDRIARVMRHGERGRRERPDLEFLSVLEADEDGIVEPALVRNRLGRHEIRKKRSIGKVLMEGINATSVVGVVMREDSGDNLRGIDFRREAALRELASGKSAVDKQRGLSRFNNSRIALRPARERNDSQLSPLKRPMSDIFAIEHNKEIF